MSERRAAIGVALLPHGVTTEAHAAAMVEWAEAWQLRYAPHARCAHWVALGRCPFTCTQPDGRRDLWLRNVTCWTYRGRPAVLIAQPHVLTGPGLAQLALVGRGLDVEVTGLGWGGTGPFISVWRPGVEQAIRGHLARTEATA